jgi:GTP-binding protein
MGVPIIVVATKVDKLSSSQKVDRALKTINVELGLPEGQPLSISSVTGRGVKDLWRIIMEACEDRVEELRSKIEGGGASGTDSNEHEFDGSSFDEIKAAAQAKERENDEDEIAYSQGYDWIQGSSVLYEDDVNDVSYDDDGDRAVYGSNEDYEWDGDYNYDGDDFEDDDEGDFDIFPVQEKSSLKSLKRIAKDLEKRGEI